MQTNKSTRRTKRSTRSTISDRGGIYPQDGINEPVEKALRKEIAIGIDPDVDKSGLALYNRKTGDLEIRTIGLLDLLDMLRDLNRKEETIIYVEAGWLNKPSNFRYHKSFKAREYMAKNVGRNEQLGKIILEACERYGIDFIPIRPKSKKTSPEIFERLTGVKTRNQEKIDAAMLVIDSNLKRNV